MYKVFPKMSQFLFQNYKIAYGYLIIIIIKYLYIATLTTSRTALQNKTENDKRETDKTVQKYF